MNKAKNIITGIAGVPAVLVLVSEPQDLRLVWVQVVAVVIILALMAWWGLLKRTKYDHNGFAMYLSGLSSSTDKWKGQGEQKQEQAERQFTPEQRRHAA